jgi:hypothetical protein
MKRSLRSYVAIFTLVILTTQVVPAQSSHSANKLRELQDKISRMEAMDVSSMAASTREIYQRTLARLYELALPAMQQQIELLASIEAAADTTDKEAAKAREALMQERTRTGDKLDLLRISLGLASSRSTESLGADSSRGATSAPTSVEMPLTTSTSPANVSSPPTAAPASPTAAAVAVQSPTPAVCATKDFPPILVDEVNRLSRSILINDEDEITSERFKLVFYTIADALKVQVSVPLKTDAAGNLTTKTVEFKEIEPYKYLGETLRIDKHLGATSSPASVSGIDKPGFAWLLGAAIENGQVEKDVRDSVLTFSTSPAALFMLNKGNESNAYQNAGWLNRVGVSASFNVSNQNQLLGSATRSQLKEYSVKYRFVGDRSPRSKALEKIWDEVAGDIQARLVALNNASQFISTDPVLQPLTVKTGAELKAAVVKLTSSAPFKAKFKPDGSFTDGQVCEVSDVILTYLKSNVATQASSLSPGAVVQFKEILVPNLVTAQQKLKVVRDSFNAKIDKFFKGPLGTVSYTSHREPVMGNYSEFKFLFEQNTPMLNPLPLKTITANAGFSFYHQPNLAMKQERWRAFNAALALEGNAASPFSETLDLGRITYSFVGNYERLAENSRIGGRKADIASLQFLMGVPLFKGLAVPFSVTYSNATELDRRNGWRVNFGLKMDTDKLLELVRAASAQ